MKPYGKVSYLDLWHANPGDTVESIREDICGGPGGLICTEASGWRMPFDCKKYYTTSRNFFGNRVAELQEVSSRVGKYN